MSARLDLHVHASERSGCAVSGELAQIRAARDVGLDGIAFTDHHALIPPLHLDEMRRLYAPFKIYTGIEVTTLEGEDCLVLGLYDPHLESTAWRYVELIERVRRLGGFSILAHPFRFSSRVRVDIEGFPPDGIEIASTNTPAGYRAEIQTLADRLGLLTFTNSDAHVTSNVGRFSNTLAALPEDDAALVAALQRMKARRNEPSPADQTA